MADYGVAFTLPGTVEALRPRVADALKTQGFGILTEIDVKKTLKEKLGADVPPYLILGACNPPLAHRALTADPAIGLLLPCNVVLRQVGDDVEVSFLDPEVLFSVVGPATQAALADLPAEVKRRLQAAMDSVRTS